jgi:AcrR family transcriptional regulator
VAATKERIVEAALDVLKEKGFAGASTRTIAARGGFVPGLIFYYFGSLHELLLAALERSSETRLRAYRPQLAAAASLPELIALLERIYAEDRASGHIRVVSELVAGSVAHPELGPRVVELMEPWLEVTEEAAARAFAGTGLGVLVTPRQLAFAAITFYLGANLLTLLVPEQEEVQDLLETGRRLAPLLELLQPPAG